MKFIIKHKSVNEAFIPYAAIENNIDFFRIKSKKHVVFTDNSEKEVTDINEFKICSDTGEKLCKELYNMSWHKFLKLWNEDLDIDSLYFVHIKFK